MSKPYRRATLIDHAARLLPEKMRQRTMKLIRGQGRDPRQAAAQVAIIAGWSPLYGCIVAYRFSGPAFFEPVLTTGQCQPKAPEFFRLREPHPEHVIRIARAQINALRVDFPEATGGALTMAVIRPNRVEVETIHDLAADVLLPAPMTMLETEGVA